MLSQERAWGFPSPLITGCEPHGVARGREVDWNLTPRPEAAGSRASCGAPGVARVLDTGPPRLPFLSSTTVASQLLLSSISALLAKPLTMFPAPFALLSKH